MENKEFTFSDRIIYTSSEFAKTSLLYLQEIGKNQAQTPHIKSRKGLDSYLFVIILSGSGELNYNNEIRLLQPNSCMFIDCKQPYSQQNFDDLWKLEWVHFNGRAMADIYSKYIERGGETVFTIEHPEQCIHLLDEIMDIASSDDYIRDMRINEKLSALLTIIMSHSWNPGNRKTAQKRSELSSVKSWIDNNYFAKISLDELSNRFFIDKYYLSKIFKEKYGITINSYILQKRITAAKQMLRFSNKTIEQIGCEVGISDTNYFTRLFRKIEGITPGEYRKLW